MVADTLFIFILFAFFSFFSISNVLRYLLFLSDYDFKIISKVSFSFGQPKLNQAIY